MTTTLTLRPGSEGKAGPGDNILLINAELEERFAPVPRYCPVCGNLLGDNFRVWTRDGLRLTTLCPYSLNCGYYFTILGRGDR